ncbi:hypothetical protein OSS47_28440 [Pseudomonas citronellolis]|uniref:hypothetical protein n=1 Tax=Pseudomonas citronellolis TaxID=53408 RepID=UPI00226E693C|nr:hypothetical protein [Pseudomonas citronellolis]WAB91999.1 hypothetical protein OSS47_28440 [Pseudomonas citronellolis]
MPIDDSWARKKAREMIERDIRNTLRDPHPDIWFGEGIRQTALALNLITDREEQEYSQSARDAVEYRRAELRKQKNSRIIAGARP